jgi:hypothetical protein
LKWNDPWEGSSPGWVERPDSERAWRGFVEVCGGERPQPFARIIEVVRSRGCKSVLIENRYVDPDYRSEYSQFWSLRFAGTPAFARRLHFFSRVVSDDELARIPDHDPTYLGYCVLRPPAHARVGRTVITTPLDFDSQSDLMLATVEDPVSLFGSDLTATGVPFCQQDGEYIRCAHAAAWICHYIAHRRGIVGRRRSCEFVETSPAMLSPERPIPSKGLTPQQLQTVFGRLGLPALFYGMSHLPTVAGVDERPPALGPSCHVKPAGFHDRRIARIACRYLNSRLPVLVAAGKHAFVLVGWYQDGADVRFIACDDQYGPYRVIASPFSDRHAPWESLMIPLPAKAWLSAEMVEHDACGLLLLADEQPTRVPEFASLGRKFAKGELSVRSMLRRNEDYKRRLRSQGRAASAVANLRLLQLPRWVWIVEFHDRTRRDAGRPPVVAEFVYDSTSSEQEPRRLATSFREFTMLYPASGDPPEPLTGARRSPWESQLWEATAA